MCESRQVRPGPRPRNFGHKSRTRTIMNCVIASWQPGLSLRFALLASAVLLLAGCRLVGVEQQRLVAKPNMQFGEVRAFSEPTRIASQLEPGRLVTGGAQASVCASCR